MLPDGFDISDLIHQSGNKNAWMAVSKALKPQQVSEHPGGSESASESNLGDSGTSQLDPLPCESYSDLISHLEQGGYYVSQYFRDTLACVLAVIRSTGAPEDQLSLMVLGPPSTGKSTIEQLVSASQHVYPLDVFRGVVSGSTNNRRSLARKIHGKTVYISDGDTFITMTDRDRVVGEMRRLFDRSLRAEYRNGKVVRCDDIDTSWIINGTDDLRHIDKVDRGARFLSIEIIDDEDSEHAERIVDASAKRTMASLTDYFSQGNREEKAGVPMEIKQRALGFIDHIFSDPVSPNISQYLEKIKRLARLLTYLRSKPFDDDRNVRFRREMGSRLTNQLIKFAYCLCIVYTTPRMTKDIYRHLVRIVLDTSKGFKTDIIRCLIEEKHLTTDQIVFRIDHNKSHTVRLLGSLQTVGIIQKGDSKSNGSALRGNRSHTWTLTPEVRKLWTTTITTQKT